MESERGDEGDDQRPEERRRRRREREREREGRRVESPLTFSLLASAVC